MIPQLSDLLKYRLIGLGAVVAVLAFYLLRAEQKKCPSSKQTLNGIYAFMGLGIVLVLFGLIALTTGSRQQANTVLEGSSHNTVTTRQNNGDSATKQSASTRLSQSDSNNVSTVQDGGTDTAKVDSIH